MAMIAPRHVKVRPMAQPNQPRTNRRLWATPQVTALPCITDLTLQTASPISGSTGEGGSTERRRRRGVLARGGDRKSTRLNSSHLGISYAVFCLKKKTTKYC